MPSPSLRELRCIGIVNRGEAALRCIRTVKSMRARDGIDLRCLALYTDVDRNAPFVRQADAALRLSPPGATAVSAYLDARGCSTRCAAAAPTRSGPAGDSSPRTPRSPTASRARARVPRAVGCGDALARRQDRRQARRRAGRRAGAAVERRRDRRRRGRARARGARSATR
jgi:hypothetical protein